MAEYEIVEHASDEDYPTTARPVRKSVRDAIASIDAQRTAMQVQRDFGFDDTTFGYGTYEGKEILTYGLREQREENLKGALEEDMMYSSYFSKRYGNFEAYFNLDAKYINKSFFDSNIIWLFNSNIVSIIFL